MSKKSTGISIKECQQDNPKRSRGRPRKDTDAASAEKKISDNKNKVDNLRTMFEFQCRVQNSTNGSPVKRTSLMDTKLKKKKSQNTDACEVTNDANIFDISASNGKIKDNNTKTRASSRSQIKEMSASKGNASVLKHEDQSGNSILEKPSKKKSDMAKKPKDNDVSSSDVVSEKDPKQESNGIGAKAKKEKDKRISSTSLVPKSEIIPRVDTLEEEPKDVAAKAKKEKDKRSSSASLVPKSKIIPRVDTLEEKPIDAKVIKEEGETSFLPSVIGLLTVVIPGTDILQEGCAGRGELRAESRHSHVSLTRKVDDKEETEVTFRSDKDIQKFGEKKSDDVEESDAADKAFPEDMSKELPAELMDSVDQTDSSAALEDIEDMVTQEAANAGNPSPFDELFDDSTSLPFALRSEDGEALERIKQRKNNVEEWVKIINKDYDKDFIDKSVFNDGPIDECTYPRFVVAGMTADDVLEEDEEEIIVLRFGETPENRPPMCKRKKPNGMEEEPQETSGSQANIVPSSRRSVRINKIKQRITRDEDIEENELELNEYIPEADMLRMEKGLPMKNRYYGHDDESDEDQPCSSTTVRRRSRRYQMYSSDDIKEELCD